MHGWTLLSVKFQLVRIYVRVHVLSLTGHEGAGGSEEESPSTEGRKARGKVLSRLGRRCERGNFHIDIKSCGESLLLSRSLSK